MVNFTSYLINVLITYSYPYFFNYLPMPNRPLMGPFFLRNRGGVYALGNSWALCRGIAKIPVCGMAKIPICGSIEDPPEETGLRNQKKTAGHPLGKKARAPLRGSCPCACAMRVSCLLLRCERYARTGKRLRRARTRSRHPALPARAPIPTREGRVWRWSLLKWYFKSSVLTN